MEIFKHIQWIGNNMDRSIEYYFIVTVFVFQMQKIDDKTSITFYFFDYNTIEAIIKFFDKVFMAKQIELIAIRMI